MRRENEYKQLAESTRKRGCEEQNAQLRAQWEILAMTYVQLADQSKKIDDTGRGFELKMQPRPQPSPFGCMWRRRCLMIRKSMNGIY